LFWLKPTKQHAVTIHKFAAITAVILMAAQALGSQAKSPPHAPDLRGTPAQPLVIELPPSAPTSEEQKHDAERVAERQQDLQARAEDAVNRHLNDKVTWGIGAGTILILLGQGFFFWKQASELHSSVEEMKTATEVARQSAESAKNAAQAATSANLLSRDVFLAEQRPWVALRDFPVIQLTIESSLATLSVSVKLENTGKTPAHRVYPDIRVYKVPSDTTEWVAAVGYHREHCGELRLQPSTFVEDVLFPQELRDLDARQIVDEVVLAAGKKEQSYGFLVSGCLYYQFSQTSTSHITGFLILVNAHFYSEDSRRFAPQYHCTYTRAPQGWFAD
jgi:hypothetical protein